MYSAMIYRARLCLLVAVCVCALGRGGLAASSPPVAQTPTKALSALPVTALNGQALDLGTQKGWRVLYFWSGHCPCVRDCEEFSLIPLAKKCKGRVMFYAVASNRDDLEQAQARHPVFVENVSTHALPYSVVLDPAHAVADRLGGQSTPETFLLDPQGRIVFQGAPNNSWSINGLNPLDETFS